MQMTLIKLKSKN